MCTPAHILQKTLLAAVKFNQMEDGEIRIGNEIRTWKVEAKYDKSSRSLKVINHK